MTIKSRIQSIRAILLNDWDPLIVGDNPHLSNEYDDFIAVIVQLLESHCTAEQMERHLTWIEKHDPGLPRLSGGIAKAAKNLITCWNTQ